MDEIVQIPMIDVDLPKGWLVKHTTAEWSALSASGKMKISVIHDGHAYRSMLIRLVDKITITEVASPELEYVVPAIDRYISLVQLSELHDTLSPPPDTLKS